ncbi:hypothetical protein M413DRAFT_449133, partial [Hebeloma cylindrosporum]
MDSDGQTPSPTSKRIREDNAPYVLDVPATRKRRKLVSSLATTVKKNVAKEAAKVENLPEDSPPHCVVSRASEQRMVLEFAHVISGSTPDKELDRLEWSWGLPYNTLNVDTRRNIHTLAIDLHRLFDATKDNKPTGWFWIPSDDALGLLRTMYGVYVDAGNQTGGTQNTRHAPNSFYKKSTKFTYRLIPLPDMMESWSVRRYEGDSDAPFDPEEIQQSVYPFTDLPDIELHIPYHFVIVNTGKKLLQLYGHGKINYARDFHFLGVDDFLTRDLMDNTLDIYAAWMSSTPDPQWLTGEPYDDPKQDPPVDQRRKGGAGSDRRGPGKGGRSGKKSASGSQPPNTGAAPSGGQVGRRCTTSKSLAPSDSASYIEPLELADVSSKGSEDEDEPFVDDEDEEYEDEEWLEGLKEWVNGVWTATRRVDVARDGSGSEAEATMVGVLPDLARFKGVNETSL